MTSILTASASRCSSAVRWLHSAGLELRCHRHEERDLFPKCIAHELAHVAVTRLRRGFACIGIELWFKPKKPLNHLRIGLQLREVLAFDDAFCLVRFARLIGLELFCNRCGAHSAECGELEQRLFSCELERARRVTSPQDRARFGECLCFDNFETDAEFCTHRRLFSAIEQLSI